MMPLRSFGSLITDSLLCVTEYSEPECHMPTAESAAAAGPLAFRSLDMCVLVAAGGHHGSPCVWLACLCVPSLDH